MALQVKKYKPSRMFQHVVEQIEEAIVSGELTPGETLPPEMKLKDMFETSRGTIREALRVLESKGLITVKTGVGGGAVVCAPGTQNVVDSLNLLVQTRSVTPANLTEFRKAVEGLTAGLAAERADKDDIARLRALAREAEELAARKDEGFVSLDIKFHITIAEITRNPLFVVSLKMVHDTIMGARGPFTYYFDDPDRVTATVNDFRNITDAIEAGNAEKARELAENHVRCFQVATDPKQA